MIIGSGHILLTSSALALIGIWGVLVHRSDFVRCLASVQLIFWASALNFVSGTSLFDDVSGTVFALFAVCLTAAQSAGALALFFLYYKKRSETARKEETL